MRARIVLAVIVVIAVGMFGCSDESESPSSPRVVALEEGPNLTVQNSCEEEFLLALSPVLQQWEQALEEWRGGEFLPTPPTYTEGEDSGAYVAALSPILAEWEDSLEIWLEDDTLDTPPTYDEQTTVSEYLLALSPVLTQWHGALTAVLEGISLDTPPTFSEDTTAPTIECPSDTTAQCASRGGAVVEFAAAALDECDPEPEVSCDPPSGSLFPFGETIVTCTAVDSAGNSSECTFTVTVEDTTAPIVSCPSDTTLECTGPDGAVVEYGAAASDGCGPDPEASCDPPSGSTFPIGETIVTCTAVDSSGNVGECTFTVTVVDITPPTISCPNDTTIECTSPDGAVLEYATTVSDNCDPDPVVDCDWPSGGTFPIGETTVTCTATDAADNSADCSFTVTVIDITPPTIHDLTASPNELWPPNHKMVEIALGVDATDICSDVTCWIDRVTSNEDRNGRGDGNTEPDWEFDGLNLRLRAERSGRGAGRVYTVYVRCMDASGNTAEHSVEVTVPHDRGKRSHGF
jgi:hypothetical protein